MKLGNKHKFIGFGLDFLKIKVVSGEEYLKEIKRNTKIFLKKETNESIRIGEYKSNEFGEEKKKEIRLKTGVSIAKEVLNYGEDYEIEEVLSTIIKGYQNYVKEHIDIDFEKITDFNIKSKANVINEIEEKIKARLKVLKEIDENMYYFFKVLGYIRFNYRYRIETKITTGIIYIYINYIDDKGETIKIMSLESYKNNVNYGGSITFYGMFYRLQTLGYLYDIDKIFKEWREIIRYGVISRVDLYIDYIGKEFVIEELKNKGLKLDYIDSDTGKTIRYKNKIFELKNYESKKDKKYKNKLKYYKEYDKYGENEVKRLEIKVNINNENLKKKNVIMKKFKDLKGYKVMAGGYLWWLYLLMGDVVNFQEIKEVIKQEEKKKEKGIIYQYKEFVFGLKVDFVDFKIVEKIEDLYEKKENEEHYIKTFNGYIKGLMKMKEIEVLKVIEQIEKLEKELDININKGDIEKIRDVNNKIKRLKKSIKTNFVGTLMYKNIKEVKEELLRTINDKYCFSILTIEKILNNKF